jgi:hypothetical protein
MAAAIFPQPFENKALRDTVLDASLNNLGRLQMSHKAQVARTNPASPSLQEPKVSGPT